MQSRCIFKLKARRADSNRIFKFELYLAQSKTKPSPKIMIKLLIIWRFSRLWSITDNIQVVENMQRCMTNTYNIQGFWKGWHCSYNKWLVRYMYIPLGGKDKAYINIWAIFTFVAIWHDNSMNLLWWGWIIALVFLPEMALDYATRPLQVKNLSINF